MNKNVNIENNEQILAEVVKKFLFKKENFSQGFSQRKTANFSMRDKLNPIGDDTLSVLHKSSKYFLTPGFNYMPFFGGAVGGAVGGMALGGPFGAVVGGAVGLVGGFIKRTTTSSEFQVFKNTIIEFLKNKREVNDRKIFISTKLLYEDNSLELVKLIIDNNKLDSIVFIPRNFYTKSVPFVLLNLSNSKNNRDVNILDLTEFSNKDPYQNILPYEIKSKDFPILTYSYTTTTKKLISNDYFIHRKEYSDKLLLGKEIFHFLESDEKPVVFNSEFNENYIYFILKNARNDFQKDIAKNIASNNSLYKKYRLNYPIEKLSLNEQCDFIYSKYKKVLKVNKQLKSENVKLKSLKEDLIFLVGTFDHSIKGVLGELVSSSSRLVDILEDNPEIKSLKKKNKYAKLDLNTVSNTIFNKVERLGNDIKKSVNNIKNIENHVKEKVNLTSFVKEYKKLDSKYEYEYKCELEEKVDLFVMVNRIEFQEVVDNLIDNAFEHAFQSESKNLLKMSLTTSRYDVVVFSISNSGDKFEMTEEEFFTHGKSTKEGDYGKGGALIKRHITKNDIDLKIVHLDDEYKTRIDLYMKMAK